MKTLVLGMGNTLLSDDGIGIIIKRYLEQRFNDEPGIDFVETSWGGFRIIDILSGYDYSVIVDAIKTANKPQGYIHCLTINDFLPSLRLTSYHDINLITALKLAESLNTKVPAEIDIFAVEVENNYTVSENINPSLWKSIVSCSETIIKHLVYKDIINAEVLRLKLPEINSSEELQTYYNEEYTLQTSMKLYH